MNDPAPLFATPRDQTAASRGKELANLALMMNIELMPWQRHVVDTALEVDEEGLPIYRNVIVTVPRQCGKTFLVLLLILHRMGFWTFEKPQGVLFTTQTGQDALSKFRLEILPLLRRSPLWRSLALKANESNNQPGIVSGRTQSSMSILGSSQTSGHGRTADLAIIDEAMAARDTSRQQAMMYALRTRQDAQFWVVSTAGDIDSDYLRDKVVTGRRMVTDGTSRRERTAYFEWGLAEDEDWRLPANWRKAIPALGHTITLDTVAAEFQSETMSPNDFRRASLNQWPVIASEWVIPEPAWERARTFAEIPPGRFHASADAPSPHRGEAAIAVSARGVIEIIGTGQGAEWVAERLRALAIENVMDLESITMWKHGILANLGEELLKEGIPVRWLAGNQMSQAAAQLYESVITGRVGIRPSQALDEAVQRAEVKDRGTGMSAWASRSGESISALWAAAMVHFAAGPQGDGEDEDGAVGIAGVDSFDPAELDEIGRELGL